MGGKSDTPASGYRPDPAIRCRHPKISEGDVMALPFSYEGKRVVVSGGGGAGMGAAAVEGLAELGAEIHVLDLKDPPVEGGEPPDRRPARPRRDHRRHREHRRPDRRAVQRRRPARAAVPRRRHDARELRRASSPHVARRAAHDERRRDLQHLLDRGQRLPPQPGEVDAARRHARLRLGEGVVRGAPRRHPAARTRSRRKRSSSGR